jgi:hypothetical protein
MTSPVQGKMGASNSVPPQQSSQLSVKKIVAAAKSPFKSVGSLFGSSKSALPQKGVSVTITTQAVRKVNLTTVIPEGKEPPITLIPEGALEVRPHMSALESFMQRVSDLGNAAEKALAKNKTTEWNDDEIGDLEEMYQEVLVAIDAGQDLLNDWGVQFKDWQHGVISKKARKLDDLLDSLGKKLKEVDPYSLL